MTNENWEIYYNERIEKAGGFEKYYSMKTRQKVAIFQWIERYSAQGDVILEAGCETGVYLIYLFILDLPLKINRVRDKLADIVIGLTKGPTG